MKNILFAFVLIGLSVSAFAQSIVTLGAKLEQTKVAFTTMLWSASEADKLLKNLTDFAVKTPFEINSMLHEFL